MKTKFEEQRLRDRLDGAALMKVWDQSRVHVCLIVLLVLSSGISGFATSHAGNADHPSKHGGEEGLGPEFGFFGLPPWMIEPCWICHGS
ncbi:hypothetical protein VTI74DRAFT_2930 [Chaetomium olivicolor]